ncbi:hypothetical protein GGF32_008522 [Allomyces javanicus]|nr:hypothetical protein GGF32_008522 [Allomyces javanicus]
MGAKSVIQAGQFLLKQLCLAIVFSKAEENRRKEFAGFLKNMIDRVNEHPDNFLQDPTKANVRAQLEQLLDDDDQEEGEEGEDQVALPLRNKRRARPTAGKARPRKRPCCSIRLPSISAPLLQDHVFNGKTALERIKDMFAAKDGSGKINFACMLKKTANEQLIAKTLKPISHVTAFFNVIECLHTHPDDPKAFKLTKASAMHWTIKMIENSVRWLLVISLFGPAALALLWLCNETEFIDLETMGEFWARVDELVVQQDSIQSVLDALADVQWELIDHELAKYLTTIKDVDGNEVNLADAVLSCVGFRPGVGFFATKPVTNV